MAGPCAAAAAAGTCDVAFVDVCTLFKQGVQLCNGHADAFRKVEPACPLQTAAHSACQGMRDSKVEDLLLRMRLKTCF